jgi:RNA polymerase sigma factor (sigma-70 family)
MSQGQLGTVVRRLRQLAGGEDAGQATDAELLDAFTGHGVEAAFAELVRRHGPLVLGVCRHVLGHLQDAEDAFQATFLVLARRAGSIRNRESIASWLHGVAYRTAMKAKTNAAQRHAREKQTPKRQVTGPAAEASLRELQAALDEEVNHLPDKLRAPVVICCFEGKSKAEAAVELGWKEGTVSGRLAQGRLRLQQRLTRRGMALSTALGATLLAPDTASAVSAGLAGSTVRAALLFAARQVASGAAPAQVIALAEGVLKAMTFNKLKMAAVLALLLGLAGSGAGMAVRQWTATEPVAPAARGDTDRATRDADHVVAAKSSKARLDRYGDPLPAGATARLGTLRLRHNHTVSSARYCDGGRRIVSSSWDETIRVWDAATGRQLYRLHKPAPPVTVLAATRDAHALVAWDDRQKRLVFLDLATGKEVGHMDGCAGGVGSAQFSADGSRLVTMSGRTAQVWDMARKQELRRVEVPVQEVREVALAPDVKLLAVTCPDHSVRLWNLDTGKELPTLRGHTDGVYNVAISPDGKLAATGGGIKDGTVRLWEVATGKELHRWQGPAGWVRPTAFSPDGRTLAAGGQDSTVRLYDVASRRERGRCRLPGPRDTWVMSVDFAPDGRRLITAGTEKVIRVWDVAACKELRPWDGHENEVHAVLATPDGRRIVTVGGDGSVYVWNPATAGVVNRFVLPHGVPSAALAPDGKVLATAGEKVVRLWDLATGAEVRQLVGHTGGVSDVAFSPDGRLLASGGWEDHTIRLWDSATGKERRKIGPLPMPAGWNYGDCPLVFSRDAKVLISGSADRINPRIYWWDVATGKELRHVQPGASRLALSADGRTLGVTSWEGVRLLDAANGKERLRLKTGAGGVALTPDGKMLATGGTDGIVHLWELATGRERCAFRGHDSGAARGGGFFAAGVGCLAFLGDGRALVSGGGDTTLLVWDVFGTRAARAAPDYRGRDALWAALADPDSAKAFEGVRRLVAEPTEAVTLLRQRLGPAAAPDRRHVAELIGRLNDRQFVVRQQAARELEDLGDGAEPLVRHALADHPAPEVRRRLDQILRQWNPNTPTGGPLRDLRAVEVLEHLDTPAARQLLEALAEGAPGARRTREAAAALRRLGDRRRAAHTT